MKKSLFVILILVSTWSLNFAHNGDTTITEKERETTTNILIGEWSFTNMSFDVADNVHYCEDLVIAKDAFVKFHFDMEGGYTLTYGNGVTETIENGNWEITRDSHNLVLYPDGEAPAKFIIIEKMEEEKVELKFDINTVGLNNLFCEKINVLKFSKNILPLNNSIIR